MASGLSKFLLAWYIYASGRMSPPSSEDEIGKLRKCHFHKLLLLTATGAWKLTKSSQSKERKPSAKEIHILIEIKIICFHRSSSSSNEVYFYSIDGNKLWLYLELKGQ